VQSNFNHNVCGLFVILIGLSALAHQLTGARVLRHWPLLFLPFGLLILVIAEPTVWPLGPESFWKTLISPEALVHRFGAALVVALGLFQWRVRTSASAMSRWRFAFPVLCFVGGAMLLSHSHTVFAVKWAFLIEVSHNAIGILAVLTGAASWLELRLEGPERRLAGIVWPICLTLVGVVLFLYRETVFA
jgi:putative copper resistance protein D